MSADCYWCKDGATGSVPGTTVGKMGEAIGCCKQCQVFACGHHAMRHKFKQEYKCYDCLVINLISSALADTNLTKEDKQQLQKFDKELASAVTPLNADKLKNFQEFELGFLETPEWINSLKQIQINWDEWPEKAAEPLRKLSRDSELFLLAAGWILNEVEGTDKLSEFTHPFRYSLVNSIIINAL